MQIQLILNKNCIETEAKKAYERRVKLYFNTRKQNPDQRRLEEEIECLKTFLEKTDFGYLRSSCPILNGKQGTPVNIDVCVTGDDISIFHNKIRQCNKSR